MSENRVNFVSSHKSFARKRKRGLETSLSIEEGHKHSVRVLIQEVPVGTTSPIFAAFMAVNPPPGQQLKYNHYAKPSRGLQLVSRLDSNYIHASSSTVDYQSSNQMGYANVEAGHNSQYLIGIYNKKTHTITLSLAQVHIVSRQVKGIISSGVPAQSTRTDFAAMRNDLSTAFGNAKQAKAVRDREHRAIGAAAVGSTIVALQHGIQTTTASFPSRDQVHVAADTNRPVLRFNQAATKLDDVYPLYDTVPRVELEAIPVDDLLEGSLLGLPYEARTAYTKSIWNRLAGQLGREKLQILLYIGYLIRFGQAAYLEDSRLEYGERHQAVPSAVLDGFYSRFTAKVRDTAARQKQTPETTLRLQSYVLALALRLEDWIIDLEPIAKDFKLEATDVANRCQGLGCHVAPRKPTAKAEQEALHLDVAKSCLRAELKLPLVFPKVKRHIGR